MKTALALLVLLFVVGVVLATCGGGRPGGGPVRTIIRHP
jgi:hypothetical protein